MKYSIITINYNNKDGLERTINSIISQTFHNYEYIIIDGGSTDGSLDVIKNYKHYINYWVSEPDNGIYNAMNKGIRQASGVYLNFMNSGDMFHSSYVLQEVSNLNAEEDIIIGICFDKENNIRHSIPMQEPTLLTMLKDPFNHQSMFFKKELFTDRQLTTLAEYCRQIANIRAEIEEDAISAGLPDDHISLDAGGRGALAYSEAIIVYLSFGLSRLTNIFNAFCRWESSREQALTLFSRQAIPMIWDFAENNPFAKAAGDFTVSLGSIVRVLENFTQKTPGYAKQFDAQSDCGLRGIMIEILSNPQQSWGESCTQVAIPKVTEKNSVVYYVRV